jgi:hypothetical protein
MNVPKAGGTPPLLVSGESLGGQLAVDATSIYWIVADVSNPPGSTAPPGFSVMKLTPK